MLHAQHHYSVHIAELCQKASWATAKENEAPGLTESSLAGYGGYAASSSSLPRRKGGMCQEGASGVVP